MSTNDNTRREKPRTAITGIRRSKPAVAAGFGRPFLEGEDPRRHKLGRTSLGRAAFMARLNNALAGGEGDPEELARILWKYARAGKPWAISEILDRICGRPTQPLEHSGEVKTGEKLIVKVIHVNDEASGGDRGRP